MKRLAILGSIVAVGLAAAGLNAQGLPGIGATEQVSDNVYKIFGAGGNTTAFVRSDGVVLVDTKLANNGTAILAKVAEVTDKPVTMIINTHSHPDHLGSNTEIDTARGGVEVVVQANTAKRMAAMPTNNRVTQSFEDRLTLGSGKDQIDLYYFGPGHTDGDAFVVFPAAKTVMMGDIMAWSMAPLIDPGSGGSAVKLADTLEQAVAGIQGVEKVIEGHGYVTDWQRFVDFAAFSRAVVEESKKAVEAGKTPKDVVAALVATGKYDVFLKDEVLKGLEYGGTGKSRAQINAIVAMQELRGEEPQLIMGLPPEEQ